MFGIERAFGLFIGDHLDSTQKPLGARMANQRMAGELGDARLESLADRPHMADKIVFFVYFERLDRDRRGDRVGGIGEAMAERADFTEIAI